MDVHTYVRIYMDTSGSMDVDVPRDNSWSGTNLAWTPRRIDPQLIEVKWRIHMRR